MKKLLLVAISVGIFLMVTIAAAIVILAPRTQTQEPAFYSSVPISQGRVQPAAEVINNMPQEPVFSIPETPDTVTIVDRNDGGNLTIQIPRPSTAAVPDTPQPAAAARPAATTATAAAARTTTTTAAATTPAPAATRPAPAAQVSAAPRAATTPARPAAPRTINDYWIQIGAYSAIIRAEDVKEHLASQGLISIIETRIINGQDLYRVRLGPYTSEREANHWLAIVKNIDGFHDSQVRQTIRQQ